MSTAQGRVCPLCHRQIPGTRGLNRHISSCPGPANIPLWRYAYCDDDQDSIEPDPNVLGNTDHQTVVTFTLPAARDTDSLSITQGLGDNHEEDIINEVDGVPTSIEDTCASEAGHRQQPSSRMTVSSGASTVVETYVDIEGGMIPPGQHHTRDDCAPFDTETPLLPLLEPLPNQPLHLMSPTVFFPFQCLAEYQLCSWLFQTKVSGNSMNEFFRFHMGPWSKLSTIDSVAKWKQILQQIPYGIPNDNIIERQIKVLLPGTSSGISYTIRYRSIMNIVRFLIGHPPFQPNLSYAPVRLYKDEDKHCRIWNEMHTGSWWWDTQRKLPPGSTIIPVILASDKTQLTQHHGDKSSHPVYVTIGNLDKSTRRSQKRPSKILLGFLPIPKKQDYQQLGLKSYAFKRLIYNQAMKAMTKGMSGADPKVGYQINYNVVYQSYPAMNQKECCYGAPMA